VSNNFIKYSPETRLNDSLFVIITHICQEIKQTYWQIWITFKRDFVSSYNQTVLGFLWSIILPIIPITAYIILAYIRVLKTTEAMPFVIYITLGMTIWFFLSSTITSTIASLQRGKAVLETSRYPMIAIILSNFGQMIYDLTVRILFVFVVMVYYQSLPSWRIVFLPILLIPLVMFSLGSGVLLAILNIIVQDTQKIVQVVMQYGIFFSSVIFPMTTDGLVGHLNTLNPFNTYVVVIREFIVFGTIPHYNLYGVTTLASFIFLLASCKILYLMEYRVKGYL